MIEIDVFPERYVILIEGREFISTPKSIFLDEGEKIHCIINFESTPYTINSFVYNKGGKVFATNPKIKFIDLGTKYILKPEERKFVPYTLPCPVIQHRAVFGVSNYLITIYKNGSFGLIAEGQGGFLTADIPVEVKDAEFLPLNISGKNLLLVKCSGEHNYYLVLNLSAPSCVEFCGLYDSAQVGLVNVVFTRTEKDFMRHKSRVKLSFEGGIKEVTSLDCEEYSKRDYNFFLTPVLFLEAIKARSIEETLQFMSSSLKNEINFEDLINYIGEFDEIIPKSPEMVYVVSHKGQIMPAKKVEITYEGGLINDLNVI